MLTLPSGTKIYLARDPADMRKSINGLSILVTQVMRKDPKQAALFVFFNRSRDKVKILFWDRTGFVIWYKCLAKGRYRPPKFPQQSHQLSVSDLTCLLEGFDLHNSRRHCLV